MWILHGHRLREAAFSKDVHFIAHPVTAFLQYDIYFLRIACYSALLGTHFLIRISLESDHMWAECWWQKSPSPSPFPRLHTPDLLVGADAGFRKCRSLFGVLVLYIDFKTWRQVLDMVTLYLVTTSNNVKRGCSILDLGHKPYWSWLGCRMQVYVGLLRH